MAATRSLAAAAALAATLDADDMALDLPPGGEGEGEGGEMMDEAGQAAMANRLDGWLAETHQGPYHPLNAGGARGSGGGWGAGSGPSKMMSVPAVCSTPNPLARTLVLHPQLQAASQQLPGPQGGAAAQDAAAAPEAGRQKSFGAGADDLDAARGSGGIDISLAQVI